jgi:hypothetical protein
MSLSRITLLIGLVSVSICLAGCGSTPAPNNTTNAATPVRSDRLATAEFPFSTKEPEVYQGDFYAGTPEKTNHWWVARNGDKWRIDYYDDNNSKDRSEIRSDKHYYIDHKRKIYTVEPEAEKGTVAGSYFSTLLSGFFKSKDYRKFEELPAEGPLKKYKVQEEKSADELILYVEPESKMVVKQEFLALNEREGNTSKAKYSYEIKNFKAEAGDDLFQLPAGYKEIEWKQYAPYAPGEQK